MIQRLLVLAALAASVPAPDQDPPRLRGFLPESALAQVDREKRFAALPDAERIRAWHRELTRVPHPPTSARNEELARWMAREWEAQGLEDVTLRRYDVLSSNPREVRVEMLAPERYVPTLREDPVPADPDTSQPEISGAWLSFSASGDVSAPVVYANSGNPADYDRLRANGIDPRGKIVIVRYSVPYSYRGFKALTAQREGAAGMIVYSDPAQDGYARGKVFPDGPWGGDSHIQRGGIAYDFIVPGDPLTPGWASLPGAPRLRLDEAVSVPKLVAVPMSWRDIKPILEKLGGPDAPAEWQGGLPLRYRMGGKDAVVRLKVDMATEVLPNWVVEGRIRGSERPDEWVVLGNHRDAWVFGGVDPSSGTASMLELTRTLGQLARDGQRPRRTLVFCSWDGEEVTLTGSTEWGEDLAGELKQKAVAYLNVDSSASGRRLSASGVASLAPMMVEVARSLPDPSGGSLFDAWRRTEEPKDGWEPEQRLLDPRIGSGSDHTVFLNHLAVPVVDMSFDGPYGVYHSAYDNHYWVSRIGDPGFRYHKLMTQLWGVLALRLANAEAVPLAFEPYAAAVTDFVRAAGRLPGAEQLDLGPLRAAVRTLRAAGRRLDDRVEAALRAGTLTPALADELNRRLIAFERGWLHAAGIPGRPWFKHLLYAPRYTYAAMTLPGLTEAIEDGDAARAREQAGLIAAASTANARLLDEAAALLPPAAAEGSLEAALRRIRDGVDGRMALYVEDVERGEVTAIDADSAYETFSVIKVPLMAAVLQQVQDGRLRLDQRVELPAAARRIPSGVLYALDPGLRPTLRDLLTLMIIVSDNTATDALGDLVGRDQVTRYARGLGLRETTLRFSDLDWDRMWLSQLDAGYANASGDRTIDFPFERYTSAQVGEAFRHVIEDTGLFFGRSTARETGTLFARMARGGLVSKPMSELMLQILKRQQVDDRIPRYLGDGVVAAHKTGDGQPWVANDAGIVWVKGRPIVIVAFVGHHRGSTEAAHDAIGRVAATVVHHYGGEVDPAGLSTTKY
jgi:N-acetylated-alpha-linked acidic dipeptidase